MSLVTFQFSLLVTVRKNISCAAVELFILHAVKLVTCRKSRGPLFCLSQIKLKRLMWISIKIDVMFQIVQVCDMLLTY